MKSVKVQYTVQENFVETNKSNIHKVMDALLANPIAGLKYAAFTLDDEQTFIHINIAKDDSTLSQFTEMEEFKSFQAALKASNPVSPPAAENLNLVGAGYEI